MKKAKVRNSKYKSGPKKRKNGGFAGGTTGLLEMISERMCLSEGEEAIRRILREVYRQGKIGTKELAYVTRLPVPLVAAVRRELEKERLLSRKGGAILTKEGENYVRKILGISMVEKLVCPTCLGKKILIYDQFSGILKKLQEYSTLRPKPFTWLDQAFGTPETAVLRALFMLEEGDVEGRNILFLGDDDLTSVATSLLKAAKKITVIDIDKRLLDLIENISRREKLKIECIRYDLRNALPDDLKNKHDVAFTDPPYTIQGLKLFISRGIEALRKRKCASIYLAFAHKRPEEMLKFQIAINEMGLFIRELIPRFNTYEGAEMFANTTFLAKLETTGETRPSITRRFERKIYSGEIHPTVRIYKCKCRKEIEVGIGKSFSTIEELKSKGCPMCGRKQGFKLFKKIRLKGKITDVGLLDKLKLRGFTREDFPAILEFERELAKISQPESPILDEKFHKQKLEKAMKAEPNGLIVAHFNDEIVGWIWLRTERERVSGNKFGYLKSIYVKEEYREMGIGRRLIQVAEEYFLNKGITQLNLIVSASNGKAISFFREMDFEETHLTVRKKLPAGET